MDGLCVGKWCGLKVWAFFLAFLLITVSSFAGQSNGDSPQNRDDGAEYVIGLGDQLQVLVWKETDLTQSMAVRIDGRISLPLIGDVVAAGKTIKELKGILEQKFSEVIAEPAVSVMLMQSRSWRYYIIGQVKQPGEFPIDYPITVLQAIARSGGFLEWAKLERISIIRQEPNGEKILKFNYESLLKGKNLEQNFLIKPGDTIVIP